jgi:hypothetical protein
MLGLVARDWWVFAIRGIAALVLGVLAFIWPETTLTVLVLLFGAYVLVDGASLLIALVRGDAVARRHVLRAGPGFRGMTRLARSPRALWQDILEANRVEVRRALRALVRRLERRRRSPPRR